MEENLSVEGKVRRLSSFDDDITDSSKKQEYKRNYMKETSYTHAVLLYPDCPGHMAALAKIMQKWDYTYILHDKDLKEDDVDLHIDDPELLKKAHVHAIVHYPTRVHTNVIWKNLNIEPRFVQRVSNRDAMLCYLVHTGFHDKHQYDRGEVMSNRPSFFLEAMAKIDTDSEKLLKITEIIQNKNCTEIRYTVKLLCREGYGSFVLRHFNIIQALVNALWEERRVSSISLNLDGMKHVVHSYVSVDGDSDVGLD